MSRVITFSTAFPSHHTKVGKATMFVERLRYTFKLLGYELEQPCLPWKYDDDKRYGIKNHTIRKGNRWKVGDKFSPRIWSDKPYRSPMITIAPDITITNVWDFEVDELGVIAVNGRYYANTLDGDENDRLENELANNDGLTWDDFYQWLVYPCFKKHVAFQGQIICWNKCIKY